MPRHDVSAPCYRNRQAAVARLLTVAETLLCALAMVLAQACSSADAPSSGDAGTGGEAAARAAPTYAGSSTCLPCHPDASARWRGSHHDLAMQVADQGTVLGDFDGAEVTHFGSSTRFFRRDAGFWVEAESADGAQREYEIVYTFGVEPLQQYLVAMPDGRYQALDVAWDSRPAAAGGQRWFHLHPEERFEPGEPLHWTGIAYTWNYMCAECHSTGFEKGYDLGADTYASSYAEIDVSCEACHGPASDHLAWARRNDGAEAPTGAAEMGLAVDFGSIADVAWEIDSRTGLATRNPERVDHAEIETCGRCHARRSVIDESYEFGGALTDFYRPALLEDGLYHRDGQILDEVFVLGSFLQSKMYQQGVTCSDCHEPHSLRLNNDGNALCNRCHLAEKFDAAEHHRHEVGTEGATCTACHMPQTEYMVVDPRADHSLRVPRPDLSVRFDTPNACNGCHTQQSAQWAADAVVGWYGPQRRRNYADLLAAGRSGGAAAERALLELAADAETPAIARATALSLLRNPTPASLAYLEAGLRDRDPLVRAAALSALDAADPASRLRLSLGMINDADRMVRLEAARVVASLPAAQIPVAERAAVRRAVDEYRASQAVNGDRAQAHLNLAWLAIQEGNYAAGEEAYRTALRLEPMFVPGYANLADLYRMLGRDAEAEPLLRRALEITPQSADVHYALGLLLVRGDRLEEAVGELRRAAQLGAGEPHYIYVHAVAVQTAGDLSEALEILRRGLEDHPDDRELLFGAAVFSRDGGDLESAIGYARRLVQVDPSDPQSSALLRDLEARRRES